MPTQHALETGRSPAQDSPGVTIAGLPLFGPVRTRRAALTAIRAKRPTLRGRVLAFIQAQGGAGATDEEIQDGLEMLLQTETPRRGELVKAGAVRDSGRTRPTRSGRAAVVWIAAEGGGK